MLGFLSRSSCDYPSAASTETIAMGFEETVGVEKKDRMPAAFAAGLAIVLILFGAFFLLVRFTERGSHQQTEHFPFGLQEQAYAQRVHIDDIQMAQATNFLNQEFTYVGGTISNDGVEDLRGLEVAIEFKDPFNQVVLRETEQLISHKASPLEAGQKRDFQVTLEHIPAEWNRQYPKIQIIGLLLR